MAFPFTPLDQKVEILRTTGWTDITTYVARDPGLVQISRGRGTEASSVEPGAISMRLKNTDGRFSPRFAAGAYYGTFGRNTQVRVSLPADETFCFLPGGTADRVSTPDAAALDITGDIDIRADVSLLCWRAAQDIVGKYDTSVSDQRSYLLQISSNGNICLTWSTDGTFAGLRTAVSTMPVPVPGDHRQAIAATLDVNNGASGHTARFYYADTIDVSWASWTQLGDDVVISGTTSIYSSSASVRIGDTDSVSAPLASGDPYNDFTDVLYEPADPMTGKFHACQIRTGIDGTVVANPDFRLQDAGDTSFADTSSSPKTWTLDNSAELRDRNYRGWAEVTAWPPVRTDLSANYTVIDLEASGILRRLTTTGQPLRSAMYRYMTTLSPSELIGYWPCEDADGSTAIASGLDGGRSMAVEGSPSWATSSVFAASDPLPELNSALVKVNLPAYPISSTSGTETQIRFFLDIPSSTVADATVVARIYTDAWPIARLDVVYNTASSGTLKLLAYADLGVGDVLISTSSTVSPTGGLNGKNCYWGIGAEQSGADVIYTLAVSQVGEGAGHSTTLDPTGAGALGAFTKFQFNPNKDMTSVVFGHVSLHVGAAVVLTILSDIGSPSDAWNGELAGRRFERLCSEEGVPFQRWGNLDKTPTMGNQHSDDLDHLLEECEKTDGGIRYEPRDVFALGYRTALSMSAQSTGLTVDYDSNELFDDPKPTDDDRYTKNLITAVRSTGSSYTLKQSSGPLNVNDPADDPDGVGVYPGDLTVYTQYDQQVLNPASWALHLGTVDELRYPGVYVNLANERIAADAALVADVERLDVGERLVLSSLPDDWGNGSAAQLVNKITEVLGNFEHDITFDCSPGSPWDVAVMDEAGELPARRDTYGSEVSAAIDSDDTSVNVYTTSGPWWITDSTFPDDFPMALDIAGEEVSVSSCVSAASDAFTRSASSSWGTADVGGSWTNTGGSASDFSVTGTKGRHSVGTRDASRYSTLALSAADVDQKVTVQSSALATGNSQYTGLVARWADASNSYTARMAFTSTATVTLILQKRVGGTQTDIAGPVTISGLTHVASTDFSIRFKIQDSTLQAKVWLTSAGEPSGWHLSVTDTSLTAAGSAGVRSILDSANTNTLPVTFDYDNYEVMNPQTMTITRSVNGVTKSQAAGNAVSLADPTYRGL